MKHRSKLKILSEIVDDVSDFSIFFVVECDSDRNSNDPFFILLKTKSKLTVDIKTDNSFLNGLIL